MLAGEAVVAIWTSIDPEVRDHAYDWYINEHSLERVGIPGFQRGRKSIAADPATSPQGFTLYEADSMQVLQGSDYANRLNNPTSTTKFMMTRGRGETFRAMARVCFSHGPGIGGMILTIRFGCEIEHLPALRSVVLTAAKAPRVTGAHLCMADTEASAVRTAETRDRSDMAVPPNSFIMVEATDAEALVNVPSDDALIKAGARGSFVRGVYRLEYVRTKTAFAP
jgi:hypothetical protein